MAQLRPFPAIRYSRTKNFNYSDVIAPPYDVIANADKAALLARHPNNIVAVDLPHLPAKSVGPDSAYAQAAETWQQWLAAEVLVQDRRPALYPYTQSYEFNGRTFHRRAPLRF